MAVTAAMAVFLTLLISGLPVCGVNFPPTTRAFQLRGIGSARGRLRECRRRDVESEHRQREALFRFGTDAVERREGDREQAGFRRRAGQSSVVGSNITPFGSAPLSTIVGTGVPVAATVKLPSLP
jgi:hypothetical protein